jgi:hypothetical protein
VAGYLVSPLSSLFIFSKLSEAEIFDRSSVFVLLVLISLGVFTLTRITRLVKNKSHQNLIATFALLITVLSMGWNWGDETIAQYSQVYWYGWGDKLVLVSLIGSVGTVLLVSNLQNSPRGKTWLSLDGAIDLTAITLLVIFYLPSLFQSFKGIIDLYHSRFFLNDLLNFRLWENAIRRDQPPICWSTWTSIAIDFVSSRRIFSERDFSLGESFSRS